ncbi:MAG: protein phosphatase 2C domain-containing protein [Ruminococcus sp.]|nr:protein phosphatase 2C domain-containing protein [Ruminococcus sp.]
MNKRRIIFQSSSYIGTAHMKTNKPLQDASDSFILDDYVILSSLDGIGSSSNSDVAAGELKKDVKETLCQINDGVCPFSDEIMPSVIKLCVHSIYKRFTSNHIQDLDDFLSTLDIVVLNVNTRNLFYFHSGDGGIVIRKSAGEYKLITEELRPEGAPCSYVYPFTSKRWIFGMEKDVSSVMAITDGVLDIVNHELLHYTGNNKAVYIPLCAAILEPKLVPRNNEGYKKRVMSVLTDKRISTRSLNHYNRVFSKCTEKRPINDFLASINDDMTVASVVIIDKEVINNNLMPVEYYREPDWEKLSKIREEDIQSRIKKANHNN